MPMSMINLKKNFQDSDHFKTQELLQNVRLAEQTNIQIEKKNATQFNQPQDFRLLTGPKLQRSSYFLNSESDKDHQILLEIYIH